MKTMNLQKFHESMKLHLLAHNHDKHISNIWILIVQLSQSRGLNVSRQSSHKVDVLVDRWK